MKDEIIADLIDARKRITDAAMSLSREKRDEVFLGVWSVKDLLAHLIGWDYANIQAVKDIRGGKRPRVYRRYDKDWVTYNAQLVMKYKRDDFRKLCALLNSSHRSLIKFLRTVPHKDFEKDFGVRSRSGRKITAKFFLGFEIKDEARHLKQIEDWKQEWS